MLKRAELPSAAMPDRITKAMDFAFPPTESEGRRGQFAKTHRAMTELFGDVVPERNAISRWHDGTFMPSIDNAYMLASALGVRPAWLAFEDGPMIGSQHRKALTEHPEAEASGRAYEPKSTRKRTG